MGGWRLGYGPALSGKVKRLVAIGTLPPEVESLDPSHFSARWVTGSLAEVHLAVKNR